MSKSIIAAKIVNRRMRHFFAFFARISLATYPTPITICAVPISSQCFFKIENSPKHTQKMAITQMPCLRLRSCRKQSDSSLGGYIIRYYPALSALRWSASHPAIGSAETISDREERHSVIVRHAAQGAAHGSLLNVGRFQEVGPESGCLTLEFALGAPQAPSSSPPRSWPSPLLGDYPQIHSQFLGRSP